MLEVPDKQEQSHGGLDPKWWRTLTAQQKNQSHTSGKENKT